MEFSVKVLTQFSQRIVKLFVNKTNAQDEFGMKKYGQPLDPMDKRHDWLNMAEDELVDCFKYLIAERERRDANLMRIKNCVHNIRHLLNYTSDSQERYNKICSQLDRINQVLSEVSHNLDGEVKGTTKYKDGKVLTID